MVQRLLHNRWLRGVVTLLLLGALAYQAARLFWQIATPPPSTSVPTLAVRQAQLPTLPPIRLAVKPATVAPSQPTVQAVSPITPNWTLKGTYVADDIAFAIIQTPQGSRVLGRGELLTDGVVVAGIATDHVILDAAGEKVELRLADNTLASVRNNILDNTVSVVRPALTSSLPRSDTRQTTQVDHVDSDNFWQRLSKLSWQMVVIDGQTGYEVTATHADDSVLLSQYGLQSKDIILSLNGQSLTPATLKTLTPTKKIRAKIKRNDTIQTVDINLTP